jgi:thioredoxin reductase (NADPH)
MRDLIIIGSGAAGLSAAVFALAKQLDVAAIYEDVGGKAGTQQQLQNQSGDEYLAGAEAVQLFERRVTSQSQAVVRDRVIGLNKSSGVFQVETQRHGVLAATAVIVATGASPLPLDVPGAKALLNHGIGYSITTHTQLVAGKHVAVIGTTRRALRGVLELARSAAQIYLIAPDATNMTSALARTVAAERNVQVLANYQVKEIAGRESVERVLVERDGEQSWLRVDAVFADLGLLPNSGIARRIAQVDGDGFIRVDDTNATTLPGLFAAGDVTTAFGENILIAIGDGARAAASAYEYILAHPRQPEAEAAD